MPDKHQFINEKIVRPRLTKIQIFRSLLFLGFGAVLFGSLAAVTFVVSEPVARKYLVKEETAESSSITISKDDPETTPASAAPPQTETTKEEETTPIEEIVRSEVEQYPFSADDLTAMYSSLMDLVQETEKGIVVVHSVRTQMDWFNNPIELSGLYAGAVIASSPEEYLILVPGSAVEGAEAMEITLPDESSVYGQVKGIDPVAKMAVLSVAAGELSEEQKEKFKVLELGNSYSAKRGELVFACGCPYGVDHSASIGNISYIAKNVSVTDGTSRLIYTDAAGNAELGTFLFNARGQVIGWVTDDYKSEENSGTVVRALSDYKGILEKLSNGIPVPYFGIMGQEVPENKHQEGMPLGIYISQAAVDGPAYNAGIQSGDILVQIGDVSLTSMREFQNCLDKLSAGESVSVEIQRYDREDYASIKYDVTIGAR